MVTWKGCVTSHKTLQPLILVLEEIPQIHIYFAFLIFHFTLIL